MFTQSPSLPATLHARHVPEHELVQHSPSTQLRPVAHSEVMPHDAAFIPRDWHTPIGLQNAVGSHCESIVQPLAHIGAVCVVIAPHDTDG